MPPMQKKRKNKSNADNDDDEDECDEAAVAGNANGTEDVDDTDCNTLVSNDYSEKTRNAMRQLSEKSLSFELIETLVKYIRTLNQPGAILIFMPGWNLICALLKFMREHPVLGSDEYILLPLHSQIPREDQYKVFEDAPPGKTKIIVSTNIAESSITIHDIVFVIDSCKVRVLKNFTKSKCSVTWLNPFLRKQIYLRKDA